jgi:membrane fusion protein
MDRRAKRTNVLVKRNPPRVQDTPFRAVAVAERRNQCLVVQDPLFRPEVVDEQRSQWLGAVLLAPTISQTLFAAFAALAIAAFLGLLFLAEVTRKERISGWLVPEQGLLRVVAPQPGVITRLHVRDGDKVTAGAALVTLSTEVQSEAFGATQQEIVRRLQVRRDSLAAERGLHRKLLQEELAGLAKRVAALRSERGHLAGELEIQRSQAKLAREAAVRLRPLRDRGLVTAQRMEGAERNRLDQALKLRALERQLTAADRERLILEAEREALPLRTEARLAELDRRVEALEQESVEAEARRQIVVTAAQAGTVTALRAEQGSSANTSTPLLSIVPAGSELRARFFVPSKAIGFLRPGQDVQLRYEAFPYQKFGHRQGVVSSVSRSAVNPNELGAQMAGLTSLLGGDEPVYLVTVRLESQTVTAYGEAVPLQPGMLLEADVLIETRSLIEWVFDPLFTLTGKWRT